MKKKYLVTVEFTRIADVVVEAEDGIDARSKVGNFEFDPDTIGDLTGWRIIATKLQQENSPAQISEHSALSLARERLKLPQL